MTARTEIAAAVSAVDDVTCHEFFVQGTEPGHAYLRLDRVTYPPSGFDGLRRWQVVVMLPQDTAAAERWIEDHLAALRDALRPHLTVTEAQPARLQLDGVGALPALFLTGTREDD